MLKASKQKIWWFAISLADISQRGSVEVSARAAALIVATLLKVVHAIWLSWPLLSRVRPRHERASSRAEIQTDVRSATPRWPMAGRNTARFPMRPTNRQEHHHAYS
jgi:hypothetical protein